MNKKYSMLFMLLIFAGAILCACQSTASEKGADPEKMVQQSEWPETEQPDSETTYLDEYNQVFAGMQGGRVALVYLDDDSVPELVCLKDGEYQLYFLDGSKAGKIPLPNDEMKANAYGTRFSMESTDNGELTFYWFEYVPHKGLVRIHGGDDEKRRDYYLVYEDGALKVELEADDAGYTWNTYDAEGEITNEEFSDRLAEIGYGDLICCDYLYGDVETAYQNMGHTSDTHEVLSDFINGKTYAAEYVESRCDVPEEGFFMRSYADFNEELTGGEPCWEGAEYVDFDNDGEDELIMHGYAGARLYFDVTGDTIYKVLETVFTTDASYVAKRKGKYVVVKTDLTHGGRKDYQVMTYDGCCCLVDCFRLSAVYEGEDYESGDRFEYRNQAISMEEFESIRDSIQGE